MNDDGSVVGRLLFGGCEYPVHDKPRREGTEYLKAVGGWLGFCGVANACVT